MLLQRPNGARSQQQGGVDNVPPLLVDPNVHVVKVIKIEQEEMEANGIKQGHGKDKEKEGVASQSDHGRGKKAKESKEDWKTGKLICRNDHHKKVVFDMKDQQQEDSQGESSLSETEEDWSNDTSDKGNSDSTIKEESLIEVMGVRFRPNTQETSNQGLEEVDPQENQNVQEEEMLDTGFIYLVENFAWVSPIVVTPKKNGKWRVCVDNRPLNAVTKRDHFPLPFQDKILNEIAGHEKYTACDGYSGYFQIGIALEEQLKTTFITLWDCYVFGVMPFGLTNAPATFQCFMNMVFQASFGKSIRVFIDDFCIYRSRALHAQKVEEGLRRIYDLGGQLNPDKCHIGEDEVILLGHKVSYKGIEVDPSKPKALIDLPSPKSLKEVIPSVQKVKYMSYFIHLSLELLHPLQRVTNTHASTLGIPIFSSSVNKETMGAVLLEQDPHSTRMRPVYFVSMVRNALEKDYTEAECMMLALIFAVRKFRSYLLPKPFVILTAETLFPWVSSQMTLSSRISKWTIEFQEFQYSFKVLVEDSVRAQLAGILTYKVHERDITMSEVKSLPVPPPKSIPNAFTLFFDGAFRKATGKAGGGLVLFDPNGEVVIKEHMILSGSMSNNEAEYDILLHGLHICPTQKIQLLMVKGDALSLFGTPLEIFSNNGPGFSKGLVIGVYEELHILHWHSTPYYPQSNGLIEKANGVIAGIIRKMVKRKTITYREATEFTPFHLVYGQEALQPIELSIPTMRLHGGEGRNAEPSGGGLFTSLPILLNGNGADESAKMIGGTT
ncbi:hypothetical protein L7F22_025362 [Adiantum nelumboides]|nr:hypothetical protein [Adiantum nelumboides]